MLVAMHLVKFNSTEYLVSTWHWFASVIELVNLKCDSVWLSFKLM